METLKVLCVSSLVLMWSGAAFAQDPVKVDPAHYKLVMENASVRVLRIDYPAGAKSPMHQHPDAIVVPLSASKVQFTMPDGKTQDADMANEAATYMPGGVHSGAAQSRIEAILVEFKGAAPGKAALPASRPGMAIKSLTEGPRAAGYRATADASFNEPAGSKHDYDQVVVALGPMAVALSIDGKPTKTNWVRGDAQFIGRGVPHEAKNTSGKPMDFIFVAIK